MLLFVHFLTRHLVLIPPEVPDLFIILFGVVVNACPEQTKEGIKPSGERPVLGIGSTQMPFTHEVGAIAGLTPRNV